MVGSASANTKMTQTATVKIFFVRSAAFFFSSAKRSLSIAACMRASRCFAVIFCFPITFLNRNVSLPLTSAFLMLPTNAGNTNYRTVSLYDFSVLAHEKSFYP